MYKLHEIEVPVASSMLALTSRRPIPNPIQTYMCYWIAFNNIYTVLTDRYGRGPQLRINKDGSLKTRYVGHVTMASVATVSEREQIDTAFEQFDNGLKDTLIAHQSTEFFVYRTPIWNGREIETDSRNQRLNGVLNVGRTIDFMYPIWSPISADLYEKYILGERRDAVRDELSKQLLFLLYTIRNNIMHAGKRADDANDRQVVEKALPLLKTIVAYFIIADKRF